MDLSLNEMWETISVAHFEMRNNVITEAQV